jgi:hypothetical protein
MRFQGILIGTLLGGAYYHDTRMLKRAAAGASAQQKLVNRDRVVPAFRALGR